MAAANGPKSLVWAKRATVAAGLLFFLIGGVPAVYALELIYSGARGLGPAIMIAIGAVAAAGLLAPGFLYMLFAFCMRPRRLWPGVVLTTLAVLQVLAGLLGIGANLADRGDRNVWVILLLTVYVAIPMALILLLARSLKDVRRWAGKLARGFEVLPLSVEGKGDRGESGKPRLPS